MACFFGKAFISRNDNKIINALFREIARLNYLSSKLIDGNIEKALDLSCMHIHCEYTICPSDRNTVSDETGGDWNTGLIFLVGTTVGVVGYDCRYTGGGSSLEGVDHNEQLHNRAVDRRTEGLNNKHILPTHIFIDFDKNIFIAELEHISIPETNLQVSADGSRQ